MASAVRAEADNRIVGNLPLELTSFVGRRRELADARRLFESSRLLTLTGVGGVGKTRLAIRLAGALQRVFSNGTWLVELGELSDPDLLEEHVAVTLGVRPVSSSDPLLALIDYCIDRSLLLVFDNCEHLVDAVARLAGAILRRCAGVKILATSRESLGVGGEVTMRVPSLTTPELRGPRAYDGLARYESVLLFAERAATVVPGFRADRGQQECRCPYLPRSGRIAAADRVGGCSPTGYVRGADHGSALGSIPPFDVWWTRRTQSAADSPIVDRLELRLVFTSGAAAVGSVDRILRWVRA